MVSKRYWPAALDRGILVREYFISNKWVTVSEYAEKMGMPYSVALRRIERDGNLDKPYKPRSKRPHVRPA